MVRERSDPVASEPEALRAWRSGACGAQRPAQTALKRGEAPGIRQRLARGSRKEPATHGQLACREPAEMEAKPAKDAVPIRSAASTPAIHSISTIRLSGLDAPGMAVMSSTNWGLPPHPSWRIRSSRSPIR